MTNFYLIEDKIGNFLVIQNGSVHDIIPLNGVIERGIVQINKYLYKHKPTYYTTYTTNYDLLAGCNNMGLNIRYGSIEDEIITDYTKKGDK